MAVAAKAGRKRQSPVWDIFEYDDEKDKSKCLVVEHQVHLRSSHKAANVEYLNKLASESATAAPQKRFITVKE